MIPSDAKIFSDQKCDIRMVETEHGPVALVEWSDYCRGESMSQIAKRTGAMCVLLVDDGKLNELTKEQIEDHIRNILLSKEEDLNNDDD